MSYTIENIKNMIARGKTLSLATSTNMVVEVDGTAQKLIIKYGADVWKTEATAMQLVHDQTRIPVPKLFAYFREPPSGQNRGIGYIVMEKVEGTTLDVIIDDLDEGEMLTISKQLKRYLQELKNLDSKGWGLVGKNGMYHRNRFRYGPSRLTSTKDFVNYFAKAGHTPLSDDDEVVLRQQIQGIDLSRPPMFSHGDLQSSNIMYDRIAGCITAIIDWECAGGYPYFWNDYTARRQISKGQRKWEMIYTYAMENCLAATTTFTEYYWEADVSGSCDVSET